MAYVGNTPADKTLKLEKQQFTTSATTTYTLSHSVSDTEFGYLANVSSDIQTQIDSKAGAGFAVAMAIAL